MSATTRTYALASGERNVETSRRIGLSSSPGVVDPVLGQPGEPLVVEPELLAIPAGDARVAPGLQRDEREVERARPQRRPRPTGRRALRRAALLPGERDQPPERVGRDREEVVAQREELAARRRLAAEHVLRHEPVDDDDDRVARGEDVRRLTAGSRRTCQATSSSATRRSASFHAATTSSAVPRTPSSHSCAIATLWRTSPTTRTPVAIPMTRAR